jgi:hypothetical protein
MAQEAPVSQANNPATTLEMLAAAEPQPARPAWSRDAGTLSLLWTPAQGELGLRAVALRLDEHAHARGARVAEVCRVMTGGGQLHEGVFARTEAQA